jgi:hypothetical protein
MLTANITFDVPALQESDIWFASSQAWTNYWAGIAATAEFSAAETSIYVPVQYDTNLVFAQINIDGADYNLVTEAQLNSLLNQLNTLDVAFQDMRTQLRTAGFITNAQ